MLPASALNIIKRFDEHGFEAYAVGGCVRDLLLKKSAHDVDITTNAYPEQILSIFSEYKVIPTGLKHGTVTVISDGTPFEITTYRTDGTYSDGRHPDRVTFTRSLTEDLARRDFTVNAMAYHPQHGLIDPFGGQADLHAHRLRCVGNAFARFTEDALRIARLFRFAATLGFEVEAQTQAAAHALCERLDLIAAERKRVELFKALVGTSFAKTALLFQDVLTRIVPALSPLVGFDQRNPHHDFDIFTHTVYAVNAAKAADPIVKAALLFHDAGKPATFSVDEYGIGHFYGHAAQSERIAKAALTELKTDNKTISAVLPLVRYHDAQLNCSKKCVRRWISRLGQEGFARLLLVKEADAVCCKKSSVSPDFDAIRRVAEEIANDRDCVNRSMLAVDGNDLLSLGIPSGKAVGALLNTLFEAVLCEELPNERDALIQYIKEKKP